MRAFASELLGGCVVGYEFRYLQGDIRMDAFSYLSVLLSIIVGLAITQILQGYRGILLSRTSVRLYAPTLIWSVLLLFFAAQFWWASFGLASHKQWDFVTFAVILFQTVCLYMLTAIVLPNIPSKGGVDLEAHYHAEVVPFFITSLLMLGASIAKDWMLNDRLPGATNLAFHAFFGVLAVIGLVMRRQRVVHLTIALAMILFSITYVGLLFARLGQS
jgi:hypothetical protein